MDRKPSSPIAKTERLLNLVPFLLSHQNISLKDLSSEFDLTQKEMIDDLNTLWMCGLPGYTPLELIDLSFDSGYVTISNAQTLQEVRSLTSDEIIVLLLGLDILRSALSHEDIDTALLIDSLRERATRIVGDVVSIDSNNSNEILSLTQDALLQRREISFTYLSPVKDHISKRRVIPREMRTSSGNMYLEGFCRDSGAFRTFRVDRMTDFALGEKGADEGGEQSKAERDLAQIKVTHNLRKSAEKLGVALFDLDGAIGATTSIGYFDLEWLLRTTLSSLGSLEVVAPVQARRGVSERAQALLQAYKTGDVPL